MKRSLLLLGILIIAFSTIAYAADKKTAKPSKNVTTGIRFEVIPAENTVAYIDGKKIGEITKIEVAPVKPGKHTLKLIHNKDEVEVDVVVVNKQVLNFKYAFEDSGKGVSGFSEEEKNTEKEEKKEENPSQDKDTEKPAE